MTIAQWCKFPSARPSLSSWLAWLSLTHGSCLSYYAQGKEMLEKGCWKTGAGKGTCPVTQKEDEIWSIPALRATFTSSYHPHERVSRGRLILMLSPGACVQQRCKMKQNFTSTVEGTLLLMTETPESHFTLWQNESVLERHFSPSSSSAMASDSSDSS